MTNPHPLTEVEVAKLRADDFTPGTLVHKLLRYAEINEDSETRIHARQATNSWAVGFRDAVAEILRLSSSAQPSTEAVKLADDPRVAALLDSQYRAGATAGWNAQFTNDPVAAIGRLTRYEGGLDALRQSPPLPSIDEVERVAKFWHRIGYATCWADATANKLPDEGLLSDAIDHAWSVRHETYEGDLDADAALMRVDAPKGLDDG